MVVDSRHHSKLRNQLKENEKLILLIVGLRWRLKNLVSSIE